MRMCAAAADQAKPSPRHYLSLFCLSPIIALLPAHLFQASARGNAASADDTPHHRAMITAAHQGHHRHPTLHLLTP